MAQQVWAAADCRDMLEYTELYCLLDCVLLASVVHLHRRRTFDEFKLDMSQFLSGPHLSFNLMLLHLSHRVDMITDISMYDFIRKGIRGGVSFAALRHVVHEEGQNTLMLLDAVNL